MNEVTSIKQRSLLARSHTKKGMLLFGKKGMGASIFVTNIQRDSMSRVSAEETLGYFSADKDEKAVDKSPDFKEQFTIGKSKLFKKDRLPANTGRRGVVNLIFCHVMLV